MKLSKELIKKKKRRFIFRMIYVSIFIVLVWVIIYYNYLRNNIEVVVYKQNMIVEKWDLKTYISWEWKIISWKRVELNFPISWNIDKIFKNEWEEIYYWEKVAELENNIYKLNLDKANIALKNAYAILEWKREVTDSSKNIYKKNLDLAWIALDNTSLKSNIDLDTVKSNYNLLKIKK